MRVAFVGLGAMGAPMARRLLAAGYTLSVVDTRPDAVARLVAAGAEAAATPAAAAVGAAAALVMVVDLDQVQAVLNGPDGLLTGLAAGSTSAAAARGRARAPRRRRRGSWRP